MGRRFFTSDWHLWDDSLRPYLHLRTQWTHDEFAQMIHDRFNEVVKDGDITYVLGDVTRLPSNKENWIRFKDFVDSLNGTKYLIRGNHDEWSNEDYLDCGFDRVECVRRLDIMGDKIFLVHDPAWFQPVNDCKICVCGHVHNLFEQIWDLNNRRVYNVSLDCRGYGPASFSLKNPFFHIKSLFNEEGLIK